MPCGRSQGEKSFAAHTMRVYIKPMGWCFTCLWLFDYPHDYLNSYDFSTLHDSSSSVHVVWTSTLQYVYITYYIIHNTDAAYDNPWHDIMWQWYHGLLDDMEISSHFFFYLLYIFLRMLFYTPPHVLEVRSIQWYQVLSWGHKLVS